MEKQHADLIDNIIAEYNKAPIDLLNIGDAEGEFNYILMQRDSYVRTINDVCQLFPKESFENVKVLEIGSFLGVLSIALARLGFNVSAYDIPEFINNERLRTLFSQNGVDFIAGNLRNFQLPYENESFDCVIICETLEHLNFNPLPILYEINRITKTGGFIYVGMPNQANIKNRLKMVLGKSVHPPIEYFFQQLDGSNMIVGIHWREYTLAETVALVEAMGYKIIRKFYWDTTDVQVKRSAKDLARFIAYQVASWKPFLVAIGRKEGRPGYDFRFTDATQ